MAVVIYSGRLAGWRMANPAQRLAICAPSVDAYICSSTDFVSRPRCIDHFRNPGLHSPCADPGPRRWFSPF
jgi:hypothetical protein